ALVKAPPTYRSLPDNASADTEPFSPEPSALQALPSHLAMELAATPPAVPKRPPTYTSLPDTASASTEQPVPEHTAFQVQPSHCATLKLKLLGKITIWPAAYTALPDTASAYTPGGVGQKQSSNPGPIALQAVPSHLAMLVAGLPPAVSNQPPA